MEVERMAYVRVLCLLNKVLGNIEKFAENQGLQTFFFKEKVSQNTAKYRNRFLKWSNIGVKSERKWSKYFKGKYIEIGDCNKEQQSPISILCV